MAGSRDLASFDRAEVEVVFNPESAPAFAALVRLCGEHDLATAAEVSRALAAVRGSVLLDLSECSFVDSSVLGTLLISARERAQEGHQLELIAPEANATITRTLHVSGLLEALRVHETADLL